MKKLVAIVLTVCVICTAMFAGCGPLAKEETTFEILNKATANTQSLDSMSAEMKMEMKMDMEGMTMSIPLTAQVKAKNLKSDSPVMSSEISMSLLGQSIEMQMYQEGDWVYMSIDDMNYKTSASEAQSEYDYTDNMNDMLQVIPEDLLQDIEMIKNEDGSASVTVAIPDDLFVDIYADFIAGVNESAGADIDEMKISDAVVTVTVANGYISVYEMEFAMEMTVADTATKTEVKASVTYEDPGKDVEITPPEGYQDFEEMDLSDIG